MDCLQPSMIDKSMLVNASPKIRPIPTFFMQQATFSTKKEKETPKIHEVLPPKPPVKSCPPISRLRPQRKTEIGARVISFLNENKNNDSDIISKHYDVNKLDLFFEQCFVIEGNLGLGSFGKVYKVKCREDGKYYAIKKSRESFKGNADRIRKLEEVAKHESLPLHPNCVRFYRAWEEKQRLYIQIELCQMSLSKYAETHHEIPEDIIWQFLVDLLQAIKHLHDHNLVHMDIKPENIFISHDCICKLGDFGLVVDLSKGDLREAQEGDPKYLAPEVLKGKFTKAADIFSLGMTILELATDLDVPKSGEAWHELRTGKLPKDIKHNLSQNLVDIIVKMINPNYLIRPTVDQLLQLPIIKSVVNKRNRKIKYYNCVSYLYSKFQYFLNTLLTIWYFIINPIKKLFKINNLHHTSTPKRGNDINNPPVQLMNIEDDDYEAEHLPINDSFSTYNNSYGHPLIDSSSSSCENSDASVPSHKIFNSRKLHTEPPKLKISSLATTAPLTPNNTPPWKTNSIKQNEYYSPTKELRPTRQKLVFDDNDNNQIDDNNIRSPKISTNNKHSPLKMYQNIHTVLIN